MRLRIGVGLVGVALLWLFTARPLALLVDKVFLVPMATVSPTPLGWNGVYLRFGPHVLDLEGPGPRYAEVATMAVDPANRLVLSVGGRGFVLGSRAGVMSEGGTPPESIPAYAAEPGDAATLALERSLLGWPVFELNFMTGRSPTWRRNVYYHLTWRKRSGERLDMLWRFEQGFYPSDGWTAPSATEDGVTGLIQARIRPASAGQARTAEE